MSPLDDYKPLAIANEQLAHHYRRLAERRQELIETLEAEVETLTKRTRALESLLNAKNAVIERLVEH